jgi:hypothetical protein
MVISIRIIAVQASEAVETFLAVELRVLEYRCNPLARLW